MKKYLFILFLLLNVFTFSETESYFFSYKDISVLKDGDTYSFEDIKDFHFCFYVNKKNNNPYFNIAYSGLLHNITSLDYIELIVGNDIFNLKTTVNGDSDERRAYNGNYQDVSFKLLNAFKNSKKISFNMYRNKKKVFCKNFSNSEIKQLNQFAIFNLERKDIK